jgi:hypothetical protein
VEILNNKKLNIRLIVVHFLALYFISVSFREFGYLSDLRLFHFITTTHLTTFSSQMKAENISSAELMRYTDIRYTAWLLGLIISFVISMTICLRKKWFWGNSILALIFAYFAYWFTISPKSGFLRYQIVIPRSIGWYFAIGILCLAAGTVLFLLNGRIRYVNSDSTIKN